MSNFQRRHYEIFAKLVRDMRDRDQFLSERHRSLGHWGEADAYCGCDAWLEYKLVTIFSADNPNFDSDRFREACMP